MKDFYFDEEKYEYEVEKVGFLGEGKQNPVYKFLIKITNKKTGRFKETFFAGKVFRGSLSIQEWYKNEYLKIIKTLQKYNLINYSFRIFKTNKRIIVDGKDYELSKILFYKDLSVISDVESIFPINDSTLLNEEVKNRTM